MPRGKGGGGKRNKTQREQDLAAVAEMYLKGIPLSKIVDWIALNRPYTLTMAQLSYDMNTLRKRWMQQQMVDFNEAKARELAKIDHLEETYWETWKHNQEAVVREEIDKVEDTTTSSKGAVAPTYSRKKARRITETKPWDVKILEGIQWCINKRCQIFGFDAPQKLNINWRAEAEKEGFNASEVFNRMVASAMEDLEIAEQPVGGTGDPGSLD